MKGFLTRHGSLGFVPHLMDSGGAIHNMAMLRVLTSGVNVPFVLLLGFPLNCFVLFLLQFVLAVFFKLQAFAFCG